jgi:hypothetical protein
MRDLKPIEELSDGLAEMASQHTPSDLEAARDAVADIERNSPRQKPPTIKTSMAGFTCTRTWR